MGLHQAVQPMEPSIRVRVSMVALPRASREDENPHRRRAPDCGARGATAEPGAAPGGLDFGRDTIAKPRIDAGAKPASVARRGAPARRSPAPKPIEVAASRRSPIGHRLKPRHGVFRARSNAAERRKEPIGDLLGSMPRLTDDLRDVPDGLGPLCASWSIALRAPANDSCPYSWVSIVASVVVGISRAAPRQSQREAWRTPLGR